MMELQGTISLLVICFVVCLPIVQPWMDKRSILFSDYRSPYQSRYLPSNPYHPGYSDYDSPYWRRHRQQSPFHYRPERMRSSSALCLAKSSAKQTRLSDDYGDYEKIEFTTPSQKYVCCPGYKEIVNENVTENPTRPHCEPICTNCVHGNCIDREMCNCHLGYRKDGSELGCIPACKDGCPGGVCIGPDVCKLVTTFHANDCNTNSCRNGCLHQETCLCIDGYRKINKTFCTPVCEKPCQHGYCIEPNTCKCDQGYVFNETVRNCVPYCAKMCLNGKCVSPNVCECTSDRSLKKLSSIDLCLLVQPSCRPCPNVSCTEKDYCKCGEGYLLVLDKCTAQCQNGSCVNGFCSEPNRCSCFKNYRPLPDKSNECVPICANGCLKHGTCVNSTVCTCDPGYKLNDSMNCVPHCSTPCGPNKECVAPEQCSCVDGYESVDNDCYPYCPHGCDNGYCILPNQCSCYNGFSVKDRKCIPYTTTDGVPDDESGKTSNASDEYPFRTNQLGIWCSLMSINWPDTYLRDLSLSLQLNKRKKRIFSCTPNEICRIACSEDSSDVLNAGDGLFSCDVYLNDTSGELKCYVKLLTDLSSLQFDEVGRCRPVVYYESSTVKFFLLSSYFSYDFIGRSKRNSQDCQLCPCSVARHVTIFGQNLTANLCPCEETPEGESVKSAQGSSGFVGSIYIGMCVGITLSVLALVAIYLHYKSRIFSLRNADNETDYADVPYSRGNI